jgi:integrase
VTHPLIRSWAYAWASQGRSAKTMKEMRPFIERFESHLGMTLVTATRADCEQFIAGHVSPFRANYAWRALRSFYAFLAEEEDCVSPMARVKAPKVPLTDVTVATEEDISRLLRACSPFRTFHNARDAAVISLLWATGLRRSELAALRVEDLDLDARAVLVRRAKNGRSRWVPFDDRAAQHVVRYLGKRDSRIDLSEASLWLGTQGPLTSDGIRQIIERRRRVAGVDVSAHAFRRGLAARALRKGVSQASLMVIAGWTSPVMVSRYTRSVATEVATEEYRRLLG